MRRRRKSFASRIFLFVALVPILAFGIATIPWFVSHGWLSEIWLRVYSWIINQITLTNDQWKFLAWLAGISISAIAASLSFFTQWHFAEVNLPRRLEDLKNDLKISHLGLRPSYLVAARTGHLGPAPFEFAGTRLMLLRQWLSYFSKNERARVLAASHSILQEETAALKDAVEESQQRLITSRLIRGYQYASDGNNENALAEFLAATEVKHDDLASRDIAAGFARRVGNQNEEERLLLEVTNTSKGDPVIRASALRRRAEILDKTKNENSWREARDLLDVARDLLDPLVADEAQQELARVLILFCEVQCQRKKIGRLNPDLQTLDKLLASVKLHPRSEEQGGERYDLRRATEVRNWVNRLRGDADVDEVGDGAG
jgi:hypothetical protein